MREREAKLLVSSEFRLPHLDELVEGLRLDSDEHVELSAVYFDTPDLRLTRSGASLRYRSDDQWTVKLPQPGNGSGLVRTELTFPGDPAAPPTAALDLLRAWIRTAPIDEVARVKTQRHRLVLRDAGGARVVEVDDDHVSTSTRTGPGQRFREVEIELDPEAPGRLIRRIAKRVRKAGTATDSSLPKVARALGGRALGPPELAAGAELDQGSTTLDLVRTVIGDSVRRLLANDPVIRIGEDPEGVHQARVATRRLRSDLRTFRPALDERWSEDLRAELRWLGTALGRVRDADVLSELLRSELMYLPEDQRSNAEPLLERLDEQRERKREALLLVMRSVRYATLLDGLVDAARNPRVVRDVESRPARRAVLRLARQPWKKLGRSIRDLGPEPSDAELHRVRRKAKQARYALEAVSAVATRRHSTLAEHAAQIQQALGEHQDRVVACAWLVEAARNVDQPQEAFVAGMLAGRLSSEQRAIRDAARRDWRATRNKRL